MTQLLHGRIEKLNDEQRLVFGWAYVAKRADGSTVTDHSGEEVEPANLEKVAYEYVLSSREGGDMHVAKGVSRLVETVVFTKEKCAAMGIPEGTLGEGAWWVGFKVDAEDVWKRVKSGELAMFSIGGTGDREEIPE